jgi:TPR repeat protein
MIENFTISIGENMKKKNRSPLYCKPKIIDGIDVKNIHCYSYREMLEAEIKNHNAEIQYAIYDCLRSSRGGEKFKLDGLKEFSKNKKFHEAKIQERYQVMEREDNDVTFSYVKKRYIDGIAQDISIGKAEQWLEKAAAQNNPDALFVIANRELEKFKEGKIIDANYVTDNFERALAFGSLKAAEILIPVYLTGKDGLPKREVRAKIIIKCFNTPKYKFYLSKDNSYCNL